MNVPSWWSFILLGAAAWRTFQLLAHDAILDRPRRKILRLGRDWEKEGDPVPSNYRAEWGIFLTCPYCAGFWLSALWWGAWQIDGHVTEIAATIMALSAAVVGLSKILSEEE
jgi:hypothetical protein